MTPSRQVAEVVPVGVCLALERDAHVGFVPVAEQQEAAEPLYEVDGIERHKQQLALLRRVYALVVYDMAVHPRWVAHPCRAEEVEAIMLGHEAAFYDFHLLQS